MGSKRNPLPSISVFVPDNAVFREVMAERVAASTQQAMSMTEEKLWQLLNRSKKRGVVRTTWLAVLLKDHCSDPEGTFRSRGDLFRCPQALWTKIDNGEITLGAAKLIFREARQISRNERVTTDSIIDRLISEYEKLPSIKVKGKVVRKRTSTMRMRNGRSSATKSAKGRGWWDRLKQVIGNIVADKIPPETDELEKNRLYEWLDVEVSSLIETFGIRVGQSRKSGEPKKETSRREIVAACRTLLMDPPAPGKPLDLVAARNAKLKLARMYHPDANGGNDSTSVAYSEAIEAYNILEDYSQKFGSTTTIRRKHQKREANT